MPRINYTGTFKVLRDICDWINNSVPGSSVSWSQILGSGTKIAEITIDGTKTNVYAPAGGGGGGVVVDDYDSSILRYPNGQGTGGYSYKIGDYCKYNSVVYRCIALVNYNATPPVAFNSSSWEVATDNVITELSNRPGKIVQSVTNNRVCFNEVSGNESTHVFYESTAGQEWNHVEGSNNTIGKSDDPSNAYVMYTHIEGRFNQATNQDTHIEGRYNKAYGQNCHVEGEGNIAGKQDSLMHSRTCHVEGYNTKAFGNYAHAEGYYTQSGNPNVTTDATHAEGYNTKALASYAHAEGGYATASGSYSHAEGYNTTASGSYSHAEGNYTTASRDYSHAEGYGSSSSAQYAHAEGYGTQANGSGGHAEGYYAQATGSYSHAEGQNTKATEYGTHAEGYGCQAMCSYSHAEGYNTKSGNDLPSGGKGSYTHSEGLQTEANGTASHASGMYTKANSQCETAIGQYNVTRYDGLDVYRVYDENYSNTYYANSKVRYNGKIYLCNENIPSPPGPFDSSKWTEVCDYSNDPLLFSVGNGENEQTRHNAFEVHKNGKVYANDLEILPIPAPPVADGTYTLQCTVSNGEVTYTWV